jgi:hypothetical protein
MTWQFEDTFALFQGTQSDSNGEDGEPIWVGDFNIEWALGPWSVFWGIDAIQHTSDIADFVEPTAIRVCRFRTTPSVRTT